MLIGMLLRALVSSAAPIVRSPLPLLLLWLALLLGGLGGALALQRPRLDLVAPGGSDLRVERRGLTHQELSYSVPRRAGMARLRAYLVAQGWRRDRLVYDDSLEVYRRVWAGGVVYETVVLRREGRRVQIGVIACLWRVGCW